MSDTTALTLTSILLGLAVACYRGRQILQPNKAAVVAYLGGTVAWGIALAWVWTAWAATAKNVDLCQIDACDAMAESIDLDATDLNGEVILSQDRVE